MKHELLILVKTKAGQIIYQASHNSDCMIQKFKDNKLKEFTLPLEDNDDLIQKETYFEAINMK